MILTHNLELSRHDRTDPTKFKIGDIVEAQVSFVGVPLKGGKVRMMAVLRALTLLDCHHSMVRVKPFGSFNSYTTSLTQRYRKLNGTEHDSPPFPQKSG